MEKKCRKERIAVVGGGITGIATALHLAKTDRFEVTLFDREPQLGGLSTYYHWQEITWDKFYHVILSTDTQLIDFIKDIGISDKLFWRKTQSGFYGDGKLVPMSTVLDFIRFPFLTWFQKVRLASGILYCTRLKDYTQLDKIAVRIWLTKVFGRRVYETIWDPLIRSKLGSASERTSAAFIWATIKRLYGTRTGTAKQEQMGHVVGGYKSIMKADRRKLESLGVSIFTNTPINRIVLRTPENSKELSAADGCKAATIERVMLKTDADAYRFDKVIYTGNCIEFSNVLKLEELSDYSRKLQNVEYLGLICVFLVLSRGLSPNYVINILDRSLPFTGIIEATNIVPPESIDGCHLVYLPKYLAADDPLKNSDDRTIRKNFINGLMTVFPTLGEDEILHASVFRETYVQPLQKRNQLNSKLDFNVLSNCVYLVNTAMLYNTTLNNNAAIRLAKKATDSICG